MHVRPIVFQPVPMARPVQKVAPRVAAPEVKRVSERPADGGRNGSQRQSDKRREERAKEGDTAPPRHPAAALATTLALLDLDRATSTQDHSAALQALAAPSETEDS